MRVCGNDRFVRFPLSFEAVFSHYRVHTQSVVDSEGVDLKKGLNPLSPEFSCDAVAVLGSYLE